MDYAPTNRDRNREAERRRMKVTGRGLLTIDISTRPTKVGRKARRRFAKCLSR